MPKLTFVGPTDANGTPTEYYEGVPARDLDEAEVAALKDERPDLVRQLTKERKTAAGLQPALYQEVSSPKSAAKKPAAKAASKPAAKPAVAEPVAAPVTTEPSAPTGDSAG